MRELCFSSSKKQNLTALSGSFGFGVKDRRKRLWNLPLRARKDAEARHVFLDRSLKRPMCEAVKLKSEMCWRPQDVRDSRAMVYLLMEAASRE